MLSTRRIHTQIKTKSGAHEINTRGRGPHLQPRRVREVALRRLRVVVPPVPHGAAGGADGEPAAVELVARAVAELGRLVYDLDQPTTHQAASGCVGGASFTGQPVSGRTRSSSLSHSLRLALFPTPSLSRPLSLFSIFARLALSATATAKGASREW